MKKKGFTLVEMLAVITIIGLVSIVAIPSIQNQVNKKRAEIDDTTKKMILSAAENLVAGNPNTYLNIYESGSNKNTYCLTIQTLIDADMLESPIKSYSTGKEVDPSLGIKVETNKNKEFEYSLLNKGQTCVGTSATLTKYRDPNLKVSSIETENPYPEIYTGMIPVTYDSATRTWKKANLYTSWYEYSTNTSTGYRWANAVTVGEHSSNCESTKTCVDNHKSHSRDYYQNAVAGTTISMDDITGMYVWIPRYQYKISGTYGVEYPAGDGTPSATAPGIINVKFAATTTPVETGYHIPSAFKFGTSTLSGFWMSKFEASTDKTSTCYTTPNATNCNKSTLNTYIVPNKYSWTYVDIANAFTASLNMATKKNIHGLSNNQIDTHLSKNSEWGAVAYLSQSDFGIRRSQGNKNTAREVFVNNYYNGKFWTGCSAGQPAKQGMTTVTTCPEEHQYNHSSSAAGTTSGTIYGVYDMSGGAWDMVAGVLNGSYGNYKNVWVGKDRYIDKYGSAVATACNGGICYGHALSETSGWYQDYNGFIYTSSPYFIRGGQGPNKGVAVGIFGFYPDPASAQIYSTFRVSITRKGY